MHLFINLLSVLISKKNYKIILRKILSFKSSFKTSKLILTPFCEAGIFDIIAIIIPRMVQGCAILIHLTKKKEFKIKLS